MDHQAIRDAVFEDSLRLDRMRAAAIERVCEAALQGGEFGVLVTDRSNGSTVEVSPLVPYGEIHYASGALDTI